MERDFNIAYNKAYRYFLAKYGYTRGRKSRKFEESLRNKNQKQIKELIANSTDADYSIELNPITDIEDREIEILMNQFYCGTEPKKDLYYLLVQKGIIEE